MTVRNKKGFTISRIITFTLLFYFSALNFAVLDKSNEANTTLRYTLS